ncbi:amidohydrolase [Roseomonas sp. HJA6]|uniref:Amidohydrolase n=1 Tax=Roseomonas alba TaxID=2846776 RepID=A0ABS7A9T0_9PROT|nr:amidohydrolase family protein [Neoroseomonas alba]MBW6399044.1 amidohydrolase [Neoroseomonas alba]
MSIIDVQVHVYERDHPGRPWKGKLHGPAEVTGEDMVNAMDAVGVDGAIIVSIYAMYRFDGSYAVQVRNAHPDRFALVKPVDTNDPAVAEVIEDWARTDGTVGIRIMMNQDVPQDPDDPGVARVLSTAGRLGLPVNLLARGRLAQVEALAARHPDTRLVIDHLGLEQPFDPPVPAEPFAELPLLLRLAPHRNVAVKISGAGTLSHAGYPFPDIWDPLARIYDAFGFDRCMWGTDWTRATAFLTYAQGVDAFRLTDRLTESERAALMGGTLTEIYGWAPKAR